MLDSLRGPSAPDTGLNELSALLDGFEHRELAARLRDDVERLAAIDRRATRAGERRSAEGLAARLAEIGAADVELQTAPAQSSWAWPYLAHASLALAATLLPGRAGRLTGLLAAASYEADYTGRSKWLRRRLPGGQTTNVVARIPAAGARRRTLVLVAHHDAAHTGWIWHPQALALYRAIAKRTGGTPAYSTPVYAALALCGSRKRAARQAAALLVAVYGALAWQAARSKTAPGANDNATGVAAALELARRVATAPLPGVELLLVFPGAEEVGADGMSAWVETHGDRLDPDTTLVLNVDSLGGGEPVVVKTESWTARYRSEDLEWADRGARRVGLPAPKRTRLPVDTDSMIARQAGFPAIAVLSMTDGWLGKFHQADDVSSNVDWSSVVRCTRLAAGIAAVYAEADGAKP